MTEAQAAANARIVENTRISRILGAERDAALGRNDFALAGEFERVLAAVALPTSHKEQSRGKQEQPRYEGGVLFAKDVPPDQRIDEGIDEDVEAFVRKGR